MKDFTKEDVDIAFNHVFNDIHILKDGESLFHPEINNGRVVGASDYW